MIFTSANKNSVFTCKLWQFHKMLFQRKLLSLPKYLAIFIVLITFVILKFVYIGFVDRSFESFHLDICGCTRTIPLSKSNILWGNIFRKEELKSTCSSDADRRGPNQKAKKALFWIIICKEDWNTHRNHFSRLLASPITRIQIQHVKIMNTKTILLE